MATQNVAAVVVNVAALKVAAVKDLNSFMEFAHKFNTYDVRNSKGQPADKSRDAAIEALHALEKKTGEAILLVPADTSSEKEYVLDQLYYGLKSGDIK